MTRSRSWQRLSDSSRRLAQTLHNTVGLVADTLSLGPNTPALSVAITAGAAGLVDEDRTYFESALRLSRELPHKLLEPTVEYWYGRFEVDRGHRDLGRERLRRARDGFVRYRMAPHQALATRALAGL